jgi:hypothetical protein
MDIQLVVDGTDQNADALEKYHDGVIPAAAVGLSEGGEIIYDDLGEYPPPIPTSKYVRTMNYYDSLAPDLDLQPTVATYSITEGADYSLYLRGNAEDYEGAWMHLGRWQSLSKIEERRVPLVVEKVQAAVDEFTARTWSND